MHRVLVVALLLVCPLAAQLPHKTDDGFLLPNGWQITPTGRHVTLPDYVLNVSPTPDGKRLIALHCGHSPHGLAVIDPATMAITQEIPLKSAWLGLTWSPDGKRLFVSGGNAESKANPTAAPIYVFTYADGKLSPAPVPAFKHRLPANQIYWSGLVHHPKKPWLFAAHRGTQPTPGHIVVFHAETGERLAEYKTGINPYTVVLDASGDTLFVSNWGDRSVTAIDTRDGRVLATVPVGYNPCDLALAPDHRLFVACSNENSIYVIDTKTLKPIEVISTALHRLAPVGSTPNALTLDPAGHVLFVANADNNNVGVISIAEREISHVLGFIPTTWYPASLALSADKTTLYVGSAKGLGSYANEYGPTSPLLEKKSGTKGGASGNHIARLQRGSVSAIDLRNLRTNIKALTRQALANSPYNDEMLALARPPASGTSLVPRAVGAGSPIKHIIYIIRENRTYDQVFGDVPRGNGDPRLCLFGEKVTPNAHKLANEFVLLDNLFCDAEVSVDGHSWSNSAYATDFNEKRWPPQYGGHSAAVKGPADIPSSGHLWDLAAKKGLTYRSYGEMAERVSDGTNLTARGRVPALVNHVCPDFFRGRDTEKLQAFFKEFDAYEKNFASKDAEQRLPNYIVMSLGEDHTQGTTPRAPTPVAAVANNDWALGQLVDRVSHSPYWPETAIFVIEDDAQNGSDHVDARRTVGLVVSPYTKRHAVDSTLYTTSSMVRTIELLLGLPPMTQFDAAAMPLYASFDPKPNLAPFTHVMPLVDVNARNGVNAVGAKVSLSMDFSDYDRAPMLALNEVIWKSVRGADSEMPLPQSRFHFRY
jgi:hypothetical protein